MERTGAQIVMAGLKRHGVKTLFGYPGGVVLPLYDEMLNWPEVEHILVRHEQCAAHMADGYARSTGEVGVCLATSGPGATNLVTGIATAMMDSIPLVCLTGNVNSWAIGKDAFQETDIQGISIPITKHNYLVTDIDDLPGVLVEAFHLANTGRKGPVLVDIPKDVFTAVTSVDFPEPESRPGYKLAKEPKAEDIERAAEMLAASEKPILLAGHGVVSSDTAESLVALAEKIDSPVVNTLLGLGSIPRSHPLALGMAGMHGEAVGTIAIQEADLVVSLGSRFDDRLTGDTKSFAERAKVIHFDIDDTEHDKTISPDLRICCDLSFGLPALIEAAAAKEHKAWNKHLQEVKEDFPLVVPEGRFMTRHVLDGLSQATKGEAIVSTDVGQHQMWTAQFYGIEQTRSLLSSGGLGTMGCGLPYAMGAKFACPDREVWAVVGDGGFQMTFQELAVARDHKLGVKICLCNNSYLGMVRQWQQLFFDKRYSAVAITSPDYAKIAEAYSIPYLRCETAADVDKTLAEARSIDGPVLCEFVVEAEENVYPMVPAGGSNNSLMHDPDLKSKTATGGSQ
jgi:acetolactate synthase-1/2/3 large subunit